MRPIIDNNRCNGCGECLEFECPFVIFKLKKNRARAVIRSECIGCLFCVENCPSHAIKLSKKKG